GKALRPRSLTCSSGYAGTRARGLAVGTDFELRIDVARRASRFLNSGALRISVGGDREETPPNVCNLRLNVEIGPHREPASPRTCEPANPRTREPASPRIRSGSDRRFFEPQGQSGRAVHGLHLYYNPRRCARFDSAGPMFMFPQSVLAPGGREARTR